MTADILLRKQSHFVLWRPGVTDPAPQLLIGVRGSAVTDFEEFDLEQSAQFPDLWEIPAKECGLVSGTVYCYWFKIRDTDVYSGAHPILYCTDPTATAVDYDNAAPIPSEHGGAASFDPAGVILYRNGRLVPCDPGGQTVAWKRDPPRSLRPTNNALVIYELPARWAHLDELGSVEEGVGNFNDVLALLDPDAVSQTFPAVMALHNRAHLVELGVNALELLPPEDSHTDPLLWHYGTSNYFAADYGLGRPASGLPSSASTALARTIETCHRKGIRYFLDVVMAFSVNMPYRNINYLDFLIQYDDGDPEQGSRQGFGGDLMKYDYSVQGYDPVSGKSQTVYPSRALMLAHLAHWMDYYRIDGVRIDSVNNISNWDFVRQFKDLARREWEAAGGTADRFLVAGEDLSVPTDMVRQGVLDALWNEQFKRIVRQVLLGRNWDGAPSFEWSVRKLIDCRNLGFTDGAQAINYLTSHDVGGIGNERIVNWLWNNGVVQAEERLALGFVCLLTAVGIPMIFAGDEFGDQHDLPLDDETAQGLRNKQVDRVNWSRLSRDPWRLRLFQYVSRLVRFRTASPALRTNDTEFLHVDFTEGKRVLAWKRGMGVEAVLVVANFSDWGTADPENPASEYRISNWPTTPAGYAWHEITQEREVPTEWIGREPLYPWEAKVYALRATD